MTRLCARSARIAAATLAVTWAVAVPPAGAQDAVQAQLKEAAVALQRGLIEQAVQFYTDALADKGLSKDKRAIVLNDRGVAQMRRQLNRVVTSMRIGVIAIDNATAPPSVRIRSPMVNA